MISNLPPFVNINYLAENRTILNLKKGGVIYKEGDPAQFLYFIINGKVKTFKTNDLNKELIMDIYTEGDFFGHHSLINENYYNQTATGIERSEIAVIPKEDFFQMLDSGIASSKFIKIISNELVRSEEKLIKLAYNSARKKVSEALILISKKYKVKGAEFTFPADRENISAIAGISPESVSRNLSEFKAENLIKSYKGLITILDFKKLSDIKN